MIVFAEISFVAWYSYNNKHLSVFNVSYLLNTPVWTHEVKRRSGSVRVIIRSFTINCIHIFLSALPECGWARPRAKPLRSFSQGTTSYFPVQHKRSSYSMKLKRRKN